MNGGGGPDPRASSPGVASLANLGNTCFLNSVLYTLRFTPGFCHSLHHLNQDLAGQDVKAERDSEQECLLDVIQTLHHLFQKLCNSDCEGGGDPREPVLPSALLHSIGRLCPLFEGNQQQDAHELLVTLLTSLQDVRLPEIQPVSQDKHDSHAVNDGKLENSVTHADYNAIFLSVKKSRKHKDAENGTQNGVSKLSLSESESVGNFVKDNFVGVGVMRTKCLECEASTYTKETFTNIDIPILGSSGTDDPGEEDEGGPNFFTSQILASETLRDVNKYWCSECRRLNEAQRSVSYEVLPTVLVLQLKRFTTVASKTYVTKLTDFIPTPFILDCFCAECNSASPGKHRYQLYSVILHLGSSLASGHYIAYVRAGDSSLDYVQCKRPISADTVKTSKKKGLFKMFSKSSTLQPTEQKGSSSPVCPSMSCCGLKISGAAGHSHMTNGDSGSSNGRLSPGHCSDISNGGGPGGSSPTPEPDLWLECDDEQISVISR